MADNSDSPFEQAGLGEAKRGGSLGVTQMSWETRKGRGRYYTRSRRVGNRIVREYVGCGSAAPIVAELDRQEREKRKRESDRRAAERVLDAAIDAQLDQVSELADLLAHGLLLAAGFHNHRGEWRKRHGSTEG